MAIQNKIGVTGPGTLVIGETASGLDIAPQVTNCILNSSVKAGKTLNFLDGGVGQSQPVYSYKLTATVIQNLTLKGAVGYLYTHQGETAKITFVPNKIDGAKFEGTVRLDPPDVGGDAGEGDTTKLTLEFVSKPTFTPATKVNGMEP